MGALTQILVSLGGTALARVIGAKFGDDMGQLAGKALEALAEAFGVAPEPDAVETRIREVAESEPDRAKGAVAYAEAKFAPELAAYAEVLKQANEQQRQTSEMLKAQQAEGGLAAAWLWLWQYFLMAAWAWTIFVAPVGNAVARAVAGGAAAQLATIDPTVLMTLTGAYLALHMGGHTVLELMRGGAFERGKDGK